MRRRLTDREQAPLRAVLGVVFLIIGFVSIMRQHVAYPEGDLRNDPLFWTISGAVMLLFGTYLILLAAWPWLRGRPDS
jgi:protein-S-isoprenylcysteine O-methyltransferase Ste14